MHKTSPLVVDDHLAPVVVVQGVAKELVIVIKLCGAEPVEVARVVDSLSHR